MLETVTGFVDGFATWQTPVSFLAGYGAAQLVRRYMPKIEIEKDDDVQEA
jgi:hypothetical protein